VICRRVSSLHARRACLRFAAPGWVAPVLAPGRPLDSQQLEGGRRGGGSVRLARSARRPWLSRNEKTLPAFPGNRPSLPSDHCGGTGDAHQLVRGARVWDRAYSPDPVAQTKPVCVELQAVHRRGKGPFDGERAAVNGIGRSSGAIRAIPLFQDHALDSHPAGVAE
jgi:hypothetical protein